MTRRTLFLVIGVAVLFSSSAGADIGNLSLTVTPVQTPGTLNVDLTLYATTASPYSTSANDTVYMFGSMYYPYPYTYFTTARTNSAFSLAFGNRSPSAICDREAGSAAMGSGIAADRAGGGGTAREDKTGGRAFCTASSNPGSSDPAT